MATGSESTLSRYLDLIEGSAESLDPKLRATIFALRQEVAKLERRAESDQEAIDQLQQAYEKLVAPANRIGVFLKHLDDGLVLVAQGSQEYVAEVDPKVATEGLFPGRRVRLNDAYAIVGLMEESLEGALERVAQVLEDGRLRTGGGSPGEASRLIARADSLKDTTIKSGDEVRTDATGRFAIEHFVKKETEDYFVEEIPDTPWSMVGGQHDAVALIRETLEQPLLYPELYAKFDKKPVKGILLYGPPGCGKTLIGKAVASNLARDYSERTGRAVKEHFMHISGPKVLNMWLGETERMVREIFEAARERAKDGNLVVLFIDEAESILRTRSSGRWLNISNTVVPQFCAEMDGMVELENVVLILTSNRPDYIDPAVLRPERIDRKIRIKRPDREASKEIIGIHLHEGLPVDEAFAKQHDGQACGRQALIEGTVAFLWRTVAETEFLKVAMRSGETQTLHWKDMVSGALLKSVVDRAKDTAIRRAIREPEGGHGIDLRDMEDAVRDEFRENEIFPKSDAAEDWLKLLDLEPESVAAVRAVSQKDSRPSFDKGVI